MQVCLTCGKKKPLEMFENSSRFKNAKELRCNECMSEYRKKYPKREKAKEMARLYKKNNPKIVESYLIMAKAFRSGKLIRANNCSLCGTLCRTDAHHEDYNKPLEVIFLCRRCHNKLHRKYGFSK